jgi:oligoribonuclease
MQLELSNGGALYLLWVDLETTGDDETLDDIIEIGALVTDFDLQVVGNSFHATIEPSEFALGRLMKNEVVRQMHTDNGLLLECITGMARALSIADAERDMLYWLDTLINRRTRKGPVTKFRFQLAGSGVSHFDRRFIDGRMPKLSKLLTFAPYDIGQVRRGFKFAGVDLGNTASSQIKTHRAEDDILMHLREAQDFHEMFKFFTKCTSCGRPRNESGCTPDPKHPGYYYCTATT